MIDLSVDDEALVSLGLVTTDVSGKRHLWIYIINKHTSTIIKTVGADVPLTGVDIRVSRYSESETLFSEVITSSVIQKISDTSVMTLSLAPLSMTAIKISLN